MRCLDCGKESARTRCNACKQKAYRQRKAQAEATNKQAQNLTMDIFISQRIKKYPDGVQKLIYQFFERYGNDGLTDLMTIAESMAESLAQRD